MPKQSTNDQNHSILVEKIECFSLNLVGLQSLSKKMYLNIYFAIPSISFKFLIQQAYFELVNC